MVSKKNILVGKSSFFLYLPILFFLFTTISHSKSQLEGSFTEIKILDKISKSGYDSLDKDEKEYLFKQGGKK